MVTHWYATSRLTALSYGTPVYRVQGEFAFRGNISFVCGPITYPKLCEIGSRFSSVEEGSGNGV